ncbi:enoyl-CoA hydratase/isomerase family protein [Salinithrix halophila]|uniref:Enoyl-CoA hydratase/isomerase family protein n=1 Tax=Salinithrix halophila TaxID=1485204 RepID=A0ABV8JCD5_9BACL
METIQTWKRHGIAWIRFHRPAVRNAVNIQMMAELEEQLTVLSEDEDVKVLVFVGDERTFVSGGDLGEFHQLKSKEEVFPVMHRMGRLLERVRDWGKPTIAAVQGTAVGGGCEIVASCDFRLATEGARFGFIQSSLGITTGWGGGSRLLEELPRHQALYLLLSGERVDASLLADWGWIHRILPADGFEKEVERFATTLAQASLPVIQAYVQLANQTRQGQTRAELVAGEAQSCAVLWETEEHLRAVESFLHRTRGKE